MGWQGEVAAYMLGYSHCWVRGVLAQMKAQVALLAQAGGAEGGSGPSGHQSQEPKQGVGGGGGALDLAGLQPSITSLQHARDLSKQIHSACLTRQQQQQQQQARPPSCVPRGEGGDVDMLQPGPGGGGGGDLQLKVLPSCWWRCFPTKRRTMR